MALEITNCPLGKIMAGVFAGGLVQSPLCTGTMLVKLLVNSHWWTLADPGQVAPPAPLVMSNQPNSRPPLV